MANLSDAFGTITVDRVGVEFLDFLRKVQGKEKDAYYKLVEIEDLNNAQPTPNGNLKMDFNTFGRWNYFTNVEGYLGGNWMEANEYVPKSHEVAYKKFVKAFNAKNGKITIKYTDSDSAMDWIGTGKVEVVPENGGVSISEAFKEDRMTMHNYCKLYNADLDEAIESLYGDDVAAAYEKYKAKQNANLPTNEIVERSPADFDEWLENEYEGE
jgi:hypothetical protein